MAFSYAGARPFLYAFLWIVSVVLLGLTAYRIHSTKRVGFYDPIIAELLVVSILTILWTPFAIFTLVRGSYGAHHAGTTNAAAAGTTTTTTTNTRRPGYLPETIGLAILWVMWLVGAVVTTNTWPAKKFCGPGKQCSILAAILAFAWIGWGLLTLLGVSLLAHHAAGTGYGAGTGTGYTHGGTGAGVRGEKPGQYA